MSLLSYKIQCQQTLLIAMILSLLSFNVFAGDVTITKSDQLINNQLFDQKKIRALEYKRLEELRELDNLQWFNTLPVACLLYQNKYLVYQCGKQIFYKGYELGNDIKYRKLNKKEILSL